MGAAERVRSELFEMAVEMRGDDLDWFIELHKRHHNALIAGRDRLPAIQARHADGSARVVLGVTTRGPPNSHRTISSRDYLPASEADRRRTVGAGFVSLFEAGSWILTMAPRRHPVVINPARKGKDSAEECSVKYAIRPLLSCFVGRPRAPFPPQADTRDSQAFQIFASIPSRH